MEENKIEVLEVKKEPSKKIFIGLFLVIVVIIIGGILFIATKNNPKKIFDNAVEDVFTTLIKNTNEISEETVSGSFKIKTDIESKEEDQNTILNIINDLDIKMDFEMNYKEKAENIFLDTQYKNKDLLALSIYAKDKDIYIDLKDIFDKYLHTSIEEVDELTLNLNKEDYKTVLEEIESALKKSFKKEYFTSENTTVFINNKDEKVLKNSLVIDEKNGKEMANTIADELNNKEFISAFSHIFGIEEDELKDSLDSIKNEDFTLEDGNVIVSIYTKGVQKSFVGFEVKDNADTIQILKDTDTKYSYQVISSDFNFKGTIEATTQDKNTHMVLSLEYEDIKGTITIDYSYQYGKKIEEKEFTNVLEIENLTDSDTEEILKNIQNNEGMIELINAISSLMFSYDM